MCIYIVGMLILALLNLAVALFSKFAKSKLRISRLYIRRGGALKIHPDPEEEAAGLAPRRVGTEENMFRILPSPSFKFASVYLARGVKKTAKRNKLFPKVKYPLYIHIQTLRSIVLHGDQRIKKIRFLNTSGPTN